MTLDQLCANESFDQQWIKNKKIKDCQLIENLKIMSEFIFNILCFSRVFGELVLGVNYSKMVRNDVNKIVKCEFVCILR